MSLARLSGRRSAVAAGSVLLIVVLALAAGFTLWRHQFALTRAQRPAASPVASPVVSPATSPVAASVAGCPAGQAVTSAGELTAALSAATPGTVIVMEPGTYSGQFVAKVSGTAEAPITLCGGRDAIISGGSVKSGYAFYLKAVDYWHVIGFTVQGAQKGLVADHVHHSLIQNLFVHDVGDEAIHLREFSTDNSVDGNMIRRTGLNRTFYGEGIYVGSAHSNWCTYTACKPDNSDRNTITNNDISETTAENIDIKEGTTGGTIESNHLSGLGMVRSAATAWVNVKGNDWTVEDNVGQHSLKDGFQVHEVYKGWGEHNVFRSNKAEVDGPGFGFYVQSVSLATVITCDNVAVGAVSGLSNQSCGGA